MADATKKVIADVPDELRDEIDDLGTKLDLRMSQMVREALERTIPVWRQRAVERAKAALSPVFGSVATAAAVDGEAKAGDSFK